MLFFVPPFFFESESGKGGKTSVVTVSLFVCPVPFLLHFGTHDCPLSKMHELKRSDPNKKKPAKAAKNQIGTISPQTPKKLPLPVEVVLQEDLELLRLVDV